LFLDFLVQDGNADRRIFAGTRNGNGDDCAGSVFLEKGIEHFQKKRFRARHGLRKLCLKAQVTVEIDIAAYELVGPC
jgi:hypothetical protein